MPSKNAIAVGVAALLVLALVGGFADVSALQGETQTDSSTATFQGNNATASLSDPVTLYVDGDGWLAAGVGDTVTESLEARGATVERVDSLGETTDGPVLVVVIGNADVSYDPFTPAATASVDFAYVPSGNASLARQLASDEPPVVRSDIDPYGARGTVTVRDRASGIATWPAYQRRLSESLGRSVVAALEDAPGMNRPDF